MSFLHSPEKKIELSLIVKGDKQKRNGSKEEKIKNQHTLYIIIECTIPVSVHIQQTVSIVIGKIFKLNKYLLSKP